MTNSTTIKTTNFNNTDGQCQSADNAKVPKQFNNLTPVK